MLISLQERENQESTKPVLLAPSSLLFSTLEYDATSKHLVELFRPTMDDSSL